MQFMMRRSTQTFSRTCVLAAAALAAGCGGGGSDPSQPNPDFLALSGVYGTELIIDAHGKFAGNVATGVPPSYANEIQFTGSLLANPGNTIASAGPVSVVQHPCNLTNDVYACTHSSGAATLAGSYVPGQYVTVVLTPPPASPLPSALTFYAFPQDFPSASIATVAGRYRTPATGADFTIEAPGGRIAGTAWTGCAIDGAVNVWNPARNVYSVEATLTGAGCGSVPGKTYDLLGYLRRDILGAQVLRLLVNVEGKDASINATLASGG